MWEQKSRVHLSIWTTFTIFRVWILRNHCYPILTMAACSFDYLRSFQLDFEELSKILSAETAAALTFRFARKYCVYYEKSEIEKAAIFAEVVYSSNLGDYRPTADCSHILRFVSRDQEWIFEQADFLHEPKCWICLSQRQRNSPVWNGAKLARSASHIRALLEISKKPDFH